MSRWDERLYPFVGPSLSFFALKVDDCTSLLEDSASNSMSNAIASLEASVAANPLDESSYLALIPLIRVDTGCGLLSSPSLDHHYNNHIYHFTDRVTVYREAYSVNFNAGLSFWLDWLADAPSTRLFEKALSSCPHFELAIKYIEFSFSLVEEEKMVSALLFPPFALSI